MSARSFVPLGCTGGHSDPLIGTPVEQVFPAPVRILERCCQQFSRFSIHVRASLVGFRVPGGGGGWRSKIPYHINATKVAQPYTFGQKHGEDSSLQTQEPPSHPLAHLASRICSSV